MIIRTIVIPVVLLLVGLLFFAACLGEKVTKDKIVYAAIAVVDICLALLAVIW